MVVVYFGYFGIKELKTKDCLVNLSCLRKHKFPPSIEAEYPFWIAIESALTAVGSASAASSGNSKRLINIYLMFWVFLLIKKIS